MPIKTGDYICAGPGNPTVYQIVRADADAIAARLVRGGDTDAWIGREFSFTVREIHQGIASRTVRIMDHVPPAMAVNEEFARLAKTPRKGGKQ